MRKIDANGTGGAGIEGPFVDEIGLTSLEPEGTEDRHDRGHERKGEEWQGPGDREEGSSDADVERGPDPVEGDGDGRPE